jgi:predicted ATPase
LLKTLRDTPDRAQQELTLQLALNDALVAVKGYASPEVGKTVLRARELCQQIGDPPRLFPVLGSLFLFYYNRGEVRTTLELAEQLMHLAQNVQDLYLLSRAYTALGMTLYRFGELTTARTHMEQAIALYDPQNPPRHPTVDNDPRVDCLSFASWTLWLLYAEHTKFWMSRTSHCRGDRPVPPTPPNLGVTFI